MPQKPPKYLTSKRIAMLAGIGLLGAIASAGGMALAVSRHAAGTNAKIASGVVIGDVPVGGLTPIEAHERVRKWAQQKMQTCVTFSTPVSKRRWNITAADLGGRFEIAPAITSAFDIGKQSSFWDSALESVRGNNRHVTIEPKFQYSKILLDKRLRSIATVIHRPAKNARAGLVPGTGLVVKSPGITGIDLDIAATEARLLANGPTGMLAGSDTPLVITESQPAVTSEDLGHANSLLGSFFTSYASSSSNRRHNVELAASRINGTMLGPGQIFSYNDTVGPRETKLGWLDAPTYQDGQVVPGPGGGVCQVSTTLYNAVLRAGMKIVRRSHHSMPVHYVDAGRDATVAYGDIDFKFQNDTDGPVLIAARADKGKLAFNLYGKPPLETRKIQLASSEITETPDGGFTVTTYRIFTGADGVAKRETLSTDSYMPYVPPSAVPSKAKISKRKSVVNPRTVAPAHVPAPAAPANQQPAQVPTSPDAA